jgi:uncharacterized membrane protein
MNDASVGQFNISKERSPVRRLQSRDSLAARASDSVVQGVDDAKSAEVGLAWVAVIFLVTLTIPWNIDLGPLRTSVSRIVLLFTILPCIFMWLGGRVGKIQAVDVVVMLLCLWTLLSFVTIYGVGPAIQSAGMVFIETAGAYLLGRICVTNSTQFRQMIVILLYTVAFFLPFAFYESISGRNILREVFSYVLPTYVDYFMAPRWGLRRVQGVFEHPILFGVFCCFTFSLVDSLRRQGQPAWQRWSRNLVVACATFLSMSSGPISALFVQLFLMAWDRILRSFKYRWWLLTAPILGMYVVVTLFSNQSFFEFYVHYFAFSQDTGWDRIRIWHYGWASVAHHPMFGIGYEEYERPEWMEASIDMFWLINFVRFGIPAGIMTLVMFALAFYGAIAATPKTEPETSQRRGYVFCLVGFFIVGWTVHFWGAVYLLFMFLLGAGAWFGSASTLTDSQGPQRQPAGRVTQRSARK